MAFNYDRARQTCHRQIARFGAGAASALRRGTTDRAVTAAILDYKPHEMGLREQGARRALIAALDCPTPPDHEQDKFVFLGEVFRIVKPVTGPRPAGIVLYYDCEVVYDSRDI